MGVVVPIADFGRQSPDQVLRVFYRLFNAGTIELRLWKAFAAIVKANDVLDSENQICLDDIATVFDQLIALTKAIEVALDDPPHRCLVCRRIEKTG